MSIWHLIEKISVAKFSSFTFLRAPLYSVLRQMEFWNGSAWRTRSRACPSFSRPGKNCPDVTLNTSFSYRASKRKDQVTIYMSV